MYLWYFLAFVIFLVVEFSSYNLVTVWLALSSLLVGIYAYFFPNQIVVHLFLFLILSVVFIGLTKPLVRKLKIATEKTNADRLIGCQAVVLEEINGVLGTGQVKVMGQVWSAKSKTDDIIPAGKTVVVDHIEGVKLVVS